MVGGAIVGGVVISLAPEAAILVPIAIGTGIGTTIGSHYGDHRGWIPSIEHGIVSGAITYLGGRILGTETKIVKPLGPEAPIAPPKNLWDWGKF